MPSWHALRDRGDVACRGHTHVRAAAAGAVALVVKVIAYVRVPLKVYYFHENDVQYQCEYKCMVSSNFLSFISSRRSSG